MAGKKAIGTSTSRKKTVSAPIENIVEEAVETLTVEKDEASVVTEPVDAKSSVKKQFADDDMISCISCTQGELFYIGPRSKELYTWADADYVREVRYDDLKYSVMSRDKAIIKPRFIIQDDDFIAEFPDLAKAYGKRYTNKDLIEMLKLSPAQLKTTVEKLPTATKESLKVLVSKRIDNKQFDSVQRVRVLDEIFGTEMVLKLTEI